MAEQTGIQWCDHTFNPWRGCTKATYKDAAGKVCMHEACRNCYAEMNVGVKLDGIRWGKGQERKPKAESGWSDPIRWAKRAAKDGVRRKVFCASLADVLDEEAPVQEQARLFDIIRATSYALDYLLLTKRVERWPVIPADVRPLVWLGTSVADQDSADVWIPRLLAAEGFRYRFLSLEPMVGPVNLSGIKIPKAPSPPWTGHALHEYRGFKHRIDWVIVGGESGPKARPCDVRWIRSVVAQCREAGVPCYVKQLGAQCIDTTDAVLSAAGLAQRRLLADSHGGDMAEWPEDLRVREVPT